MKSLNQYINEKLKLSKKQYQYFPKTREELDDLLDQLLKERGWEADLNDINVYNITDMSGLFAKHRNSIYKFKYNKNYNFSEFNGDISGWNVSNVTDMRGMFCGCEKFESKGLENWDVSNVTDMRWMFQRCENFEGKELENWDVLNVTRMNGMFLSCKKLNCNLSKWDVSNVEYYDNIFLKCPLKDEYKPKFR